MTYQLRSFLYSLALHTFFGAIFIFLLTHNPVPPPPEPMKITLNSYVPQTQPPKNIPIQRPIEEQKPIPKPKPIPQPIIQTPIPVKPSVPQPPLPIVQPVTPAITPPPITPPPAQPPKKIAPPPPPPPNVQKEFLNAHLGEIRELLVQNLKYPKMAQKLKMQGEVRIAFSLDSDGSVSNIKVTEGSGFEILDNDAVALIEKMASRFPKPTESVRINVPLSYVLH
ncbi:MAG: TonB family protein [Sulfuricurvum sp.]|uniref:energy transducer TonB n=1 Tax=Sulfuricurvum sp. TaxID=2025608 RepID=UPI002634AAB8|nr:energy transducer TonB [Sulfuricurvum sp.]MDD2828302.1 TonB family protein [Sulfuricurvum sp.]MDD4949743.1 TonB family protein [Sulfuricurvum sp.]